MHWHAAARCLVVQTAFWPHGLGVQGSTSSVGARAENMVNIHTDVYISSHCAKIFFFLNNLSKHF
jgi:hypothetical protein